MAIILIIDIVVMKEYGYNRSIIIVMLPLVNTSHANPTSCAALWRIYVLMKTTY